MNPSDIPADARPLIAEQPRAQAMPGAGLSSVMWPDYLAGQPDKPVRVLLVDDDAHIRMVIAQEVMNDPRTLVVAQAGSVREGRKAIRQHEFDVMLVDLNLGDGEGFELLDMMKTVRPTAEAVIISVMENDEQVLRAFELGATGYLVKNAWPADCCSASTRPRAPSPSAARLTRPTACPRASARCCAWWPAATPAPKSVPG
jgi:CheY-like chemotaxis protein